MIAKVEQVTLQSQKPLEFFSARLLSAKQTFNVSRDKEISDVSCFLYKCAVLPTTICAVLAE